MEPVAIVAWASLVIGFMLAIIGSIIPGLPGAIFVFVGILFHKFLLPDVFSWWTIGIILFLALVATATDFLAGIWGAKLGGATKAGIIGASIGGVLGLALGLPGLFIGPFVGAIIGDLIAKRNNIKELLKSGGGAALGFIFAIFARFSILFLMLVTILINATLL